MKIGKVDFDYDIDYVLKKIHLLDLSKFSRDGLINTICPDFQKRLVEAENLLEDTYDFEWIIYGSDGLIVAYKEYNFRFISPKLPWLNKSYLEEIKKRREGLK